MVLLLTVKNPLIAPGGPTRPRDLSDTNSMAYLEVFGLVLRSELEYKGVS